MRKGGEKWWVRRERRDRRPCRSTQRWIDRRVRWKSDAVTRPREAVEGGASRVGALNSGCRGSMWPATSPNPTRPGPALLLIETADTLPALYSVLLSFLAGYFKVVLLVVLRDETLAFSWGVNNDMVRIALEIGVLRYERMVTN